MSVPPGPGVASRRSPAGPPGASALPPLHGPELPPPRARGLSPRVRGLPGVPAAAGGRPALPAEPGAATLPPEECRRGGTDRPARGHRGEARGLPPLSPGPARRADERVVGGVPELPPRRAALRARGRVPGRGTPGRGGDLRRGPRGPLRGLLLLRPRAHRTLPRHAQRALARRGVPPAGRAVALPRLPRRGEPEDGLQGRLLSPPAPRRGRPVALE